MDATFNDYTHLPAETHGHVATLEDFIGEMDGKTIGTETADGEGFLDEGTVDASDAVKAVNWLVQEIERLRDGLHVARGALLCIDTEYSAKVANDLAPVLEPGLRFIEGAAATRS